MDFLTSVRDDFYQTIYRGNAKREGLFSRATPRPLNPIFDAIRNTKSRNNCKRISSIRRNMHSKPTRRRKNFFFSASTRKSASSKCERAKITWLCVKTIEIPSKSVDLFPFFESLPSPIRVAIFLSHNLLDQRRMNTQILPLSRLLFYS